MKGKLQSLTSVLMRDTSARMPHGSLCQKLMGIKVSEMLVLNLSSNWTHIHNTDINVLPAYGNFCCLLITFANNLGPV